MNSLSTAEIGYQEGKISGRLFMMHAAIRRTPLCFRSGQRLPAKGSKGCASFPLRRSAGAGTTRNPASVTRMRILIAEDDALLRAGLAMLLQSEGFEVAAAVDNAEELLQAFEDGGADGAVLDVRMPPSFTNEGLKAALELRTRTPGFPVLVLSAYVEDRYAGRLLGSGAEGVGYLLKERVGNVGEFVDALRRVLGGGTVMDPEVIAQLFSRRSARDPIRSLTPREYEVLGLVAQGLGNAAIAGSLTVSETAVSKHIGNIFAKLDLPPSDSGHRRVLAALAYLRS